jgi:DNA-binding NarL/FixJ family response regulator
MLGSYPRDGELTPRCLDVLAGAALGETASATAARLHVAPKTVEQYRRVAIARLGARNTTNAVAIAKDRRLI